MAGLVGIRQDFRPAPVDPGGLLRLVEEILREYEGKLVSITIRARNPVIFEYVTDDPQPEVEISPLSVLQHGEISEYEGEGTPLEILSDMLSELTDAQTRPVCVITDSEAIWDWLGLKEVRYRRLGFILGYPVAYDGGIPENTVIIAGGLDPNVGIAGLTYGVKYTW